MPEAAMCDDPSCPQPEASTASGLPQDLCLARRGGTSSVQGRRWRDTSKRRRPFWVPLVLLCWISWVSPATAVLLNFDNCLDKARLDSDPRLLQFVPLDVSVTFNLTDPLRPLNVTVYGNVSGTVDGRADYPPADDPQWNNPNITVGKIEDLSDSNNKYSTLMTAFDVLNFAPYHEPLRFCTQLGQGECPLGPVFGVNASDLNQLHSFSVQHDMLSSYRFSTISPNFVLLSGDVSAAELGCISVSITPDLGSSLKNALAYVPLVILVLVGIATITAAMYSPWGTTDPFRWTSNYGRDEDILRLVTPGFADCLQYIQYVVLTGALSLNYPGFYQPTVSQAAWSSLIFNQSFANPGSGYNPVVDGVYAINGTYGLDRFNQLVGMATTHDIWPGMIIWLLVILVSVTLLVQAGFVLRWVHRELAHIPEQDLRAKNVPFTIGNIIRIVFNYLLLPVVSLSFFQFVIAGSSPAYTTALAAVVILILIGFSIWAIRVIVSTRPRSHLFDDLPTVLLYGPLYNTFCDDAAAFAMVPLFLTFARGVAIGALQPSGIAQIVLLAICEVVSVLTLVAFRPFPGPTLMNLYHCCFSIIRFLTVLLSVVFVPSLAVSEAARGWIGYVILVLHALVLIFGFFLNALQTFIEVIARLAGAGGATRGGLVKVFGMRQLSRRAPQRGIQRDITRQSLGSEAAMLTHGDDRMSSQFDGSRPRSLSGNSALLLSRASDGRASQLLDYASSHGGTHSRTASSGLYTPTTLGGHTSYGGAESPVIGMQPRDPYYRPPRPGRRTPQPSSLDGGRAPKTIMKPSRAMDTEDDLGDGPPASGRATPTPAYIPAPKEDMELEDPRKQKDYAVREVDFYYRVRGPPLSHMGTRKLKTGPADPTGPVSSATGWFRNFFQGKTKEKGKGFEVVRSARAPPPGLFDGEFNEEPYQDDPEDGGHSRHVSTAYSPYQDSDGDHYNRQSSDRPPVLPQVDSVGSIELPSRMGSRRTVQESLAEETEESPQTLPAVIEIPASPGSQRTGTISPSEHLQPESPTTAKMPFSGSSSPSRERNPSVASTTRSATSSSRRSHKNVQEDGRSDRPSSMGYVPHYRMSDNITQASPDEPSFTGSAAELVDEPLHAEH
ncbi:TRP-like family [Penicillium riverlandense]|uniref:TRP-like family n=1 Tax=Penicillium riverlandense TaxID=1903569 RepID=UPI002548A92F|nr:TRP-like family [Penicillium riverlandense]KAJ5806771.1 TRP-like family [Penicillium riverlandense]